jgi:hypothetical protein
MSDPNLKNLAKIGKIEPIYTTDDDSVLIIFGYARIKLTNDSITYRMGNINDKHDEIWSQNLIGRGFDATARTIARGFDKYSHLL